MAESRGAYTGVYSNTHMSLWAQKIYTKEGFVKENILEGTKALDIGCGGRKLPGAVGMDVLSLPGVDFVHDLSVQPWPFADKEFDLVLANHVLEHAEDVLATLGEMHRVLKSGGSVVIQVPYFRSVDAMSDPTHKHFFTYQSLDYVIEGSRLRQYSYTSFAFKKVGQWYGWPQPSRRLLARVFKAFIHKRPALYDQYISLLFPMECVTWELEKIG